MRIENAGDATYPDGWEGYKACASYDGQRWFRVPTDFDGRVLSFSHRPDRSGLDEFDHAAIVIPGVDLRSDLRGDLRFRRRLANHAGLVDVVRQRLFAVDMLAEL